MGVSVEPNPGLAFDGPSLSHHSIIHFSASAIIRKTWIDVFDSDDISDMRLSPYAKSRLTKKATLTSFIPGGNLREYCAISTTVSDLREDRSTSMKSQSLPIPSLYLLSATAKSNALRIALLLNCPDSLI